MPSATDFASTGLAMDVDVVWQRLESAGGTLAVRELVGLEGGMALGIELCVFEAAGDMIKMIKY